MIQNERPIIRVDGNDHLKMLCLFTLNGPFVLNRPPFQYTETVDRIPWLDIGPLQTTSLGPRSSIPRGKENSTIHFLSFFKFYAMSMSFALLLVLCLL